VWEPDKKPGQGSGAGNRKKKRGQAHTSAGLRPGSPRAHSAAPAPPMENREEAYHHEEAAPDHGAAQAPCPAADPGEAG